MLVTTTSRWRKNFLSLAAVLLWLGFAAQAGAEPDEAAKQEARALMSSGRQAREKSELRAALTSFTRADEIMRVPTTGIEVARTLAALGMLLEAAAVVERIETTPEEADEPEAFFTARQAARELGRELDSRIPRLTFHDVGDTTRVSLDGKPLDAQATSGALRVNPGKHVAVGRRGSAQQKRELDLAEGASLDVTFDFSPPGGPAQRPEKTSAGRSSDTAIYALSGLAGVGIGAGIGLGLWSNHRRARLEETCAPHCPAANVEQLRMTYLAANISAAVGVASALAAVTVYVARPRNADGKRRRGAASSFSITASGGTQPGVAVSGSF